MTIFKRYFISALSFALIAYFDACALYVIATSQIFSFIFAVILLMLACCFFRRLFTMTVTSTITHEEREGILEETGTEQPIVSQHATSASITSIISAILASIFLVMAALAALAVKTGTILSLTHSEKIPLFALLGASCAFAFAYSALEMILLLALYCDCLAPYGEQGALGGSLRSLGGVLLCATITGTMTGCVVGGLDVVDSTTGKLVAAQCGVALGGALVGVMVCAVLERKSSRGTRGADLEVTDREGEDGENHVTVGNEDGEDGL